MEKKKVLIIQEIIPHYNVEVFNELNKDFDITVVYSKDVGLKYDFKTMFLELEGKGLKKFKKDIVEIANNYDVVIEMLQLANYHLYQLLFAKKKFKLVLWGIGVAAGYGIRYDSSKLRSSIYKAMIKKADAVIFYSDYPKEKYTKEGISQEKMFVANNTVKINKIDLDSNRKDLLFIGTLYKEKRIDLLIEEYRKAYEMNNELPILRIIGDGPEKQNIESLINKYNLKDKIVMLGKITDENVLQDYYSKTLLCISPDQAGLSVQKSMGYGTVFVTSKNAITGGEIFDIKNNETGILFNDFGDLSGIILDSINNKDKYIQIGNNAYDFYWNNRTIDRKVEGFKKTIEYVTK